MDVVQVSAARYHAVAVSRDGRVYTWGSGLYGQLGHGDRYTRFEPTMVSALARVNVTGAAAGTRHTVVVCDLGEVYAWGSNEFGELGVDPRPVKPSEGSANPKLTLRGWLFGAAPSPSYSAPSSSGSGESGKKRRRSTLGMDTEEDPAGAFDMIFERLRDDSDESGRSGMTHATFGALVAGVQPAIPPPWERDRFNGSADELFDQRFGTMLGQSRDSAGRVEYLTLPRLVRGLAQVNEVAAGGGFTLANGFEVTGVTNIVGGGLGEVVPHLPLVVTVMLLVTAVTFMTELTSNTATALVMLPILEAVSYETLIHPMLLLVPVGMATSFAFSLPAATPPNSVIFATSRVSFGTFASTGIKIDVLAICIASFVGLGMVIVVFDALGPFPEKSCKINPVPCQWLEIPGTVNGVEVSSQACVVEDSDELLCRLRFLHDLPALRATPPCAAQALLLSPPPPSALPSPPARHSAHELQQAHAYRDRSCTLLAEGDLAGAVKASHAFVGPDWGFPDIAVAEWLFVDSS